MIRTISVKLPEELHKIFKVKMVLENTTMQDKIIELIEEEVRKFEENKSIRNKENISN
ncbi:MAG: hypothetical protein ACRDD2_12500 [Sarcina sp.]